MAKGYGLSLSPKPKRVEGSGQLSEYYYILYILYNNCYFYIL